MKLLSHHHDAVAAPARFHLSLHPHLKDTIDVQTSDQHNYVNDCEAHEDHPHLQDFLHVRHSVHVQKQGLSSSITEWLVDDMVVPTQIETATSKPRLPQTPCLHKDNGDSRYKPPTEEGRRRKLHFGTVTLREYGRTLGDHPSCRYGVPVTLAWDYVEYEPLDVNEYELHHAQRRPLQHLYLPSHRRDTMLLASHKRQDLHKARKELNRTKFQRAWTKAKPWPVDSLEAGMESLARKIHRKFCNRLPDEPIIM